MAKTILIVDDAPTMRQMVGFTLKSKNYSVVEASDGKEALEKLKNGLSPDMIITDLNMPQMDGISLIKAVRGLPGKKYIPILMLTTESMEEKKREGQAAGATGWIVKPFTPEQLLKVVDMVMP
ncbi:MAG TPA: response regulator [Deltaproteobacteria bacterium]|nr:response regulator [Deltaproteobacteria bacterium]